MNDLAYRDKKSLELARKKFNKNPEKFWSEIANHFLWKKKWLNTLKFDFKEPEVKWFEGGKLNITENCLDRYVQTNPDKIAVIFEPNNPLEKSTKLSYKQLFEKVCLAANMLKSNGIKKGDRVCIYMPMIPELAISLLACARIGAVHSVVFGGFSSEALASRINDSKCSLLITADGAYRGDKIINLKEIADNALNKCASIKTNIVIKRTNQKVNWNNIDKWWHSEIEKVDNYCEAELMDSEDELFILYTSGSTGKPKGMVHTCGGYMVYTAYSFQNVFQYKPNQIFWCTADIGWITGHSYIVYGPLLSGATTLIFEGVPSYPDFGRFWEQPIDFVNKYDLTSLKVLGTVGEPINEEAWNWYNENIGNNKCPIVDTWWQTETGGIMISSMANVTNEKPTFATKPLVGILPVLLDENGNEFDENNKNGVLAFKFPWPSIARTIYGNHKRYKDVYFSNYPGYYFPGDGAYRDDDGNYRITGRIDDVVIVSGHNLGTAPIEDAINQHENVVESALVGFPHEIKGNALYAFIILKNNQNIDGIKSEINLLISKTIGPIAKPDKIQIVAGLPKTRSGKIMRRILRKIAAGESDSFGDTSTLLNRDIIRHIVNERS